MRTQTPTYQKYNSYRESHLPWCPQIPSTWNLIPNKGLVQKKKDVVGTNWDQYILLSLTKQGVVVRDMENIQGKFSEDMSSYQRVKPGELIFCLFDIEETPRTVALSEDDGMITGAYTVFSCRNKILAKFFELYYIAMDDGKRLSYMYSGLRNTIRPPVFLSLKTPIPSEKEMEQIIKFVEYKTKIINKVINKKQKLIKLLQEKRQVLITQAVTKGLDSNVKMKDSGVKWIGKIPTSWKVDYLGNFFEISKTKVKDGEVDPLSVGYMGVVHQLKNAAQNIAGGDRKLVQPGDIVINSRSDRMGAAGLSNFKGGVSLVYHVLRPKKNVISKYFHHLLRNIMFSQEFYKQGSGIVDDLWSTKNSQLLRIKVPNPSDIEKANIANYIDSQTKIINILINNIKNQIDTIKEFKSSLIYNAVTGKIKV